MLPVYARLIVSLLAQSITTPLISPPGKAESSVRVFVELVQDQPAPLAFILRLGTTVTPLIFIEPVAALAVSGMAANMANTVITANRVNKSLFDLFISLHLQYFQSGLPWTANSRPYYLVEWTPICRKVPLSVSLAINQNSP